MKSLCRWFPPPLWLLCILPHKYFPRSNGIFVPSCLWTLRLLCLKHPICLLLWISAKLPVLLQNFSDSINLGSMHDLVAKHSWSFIAYMFYLTHCTDKALSMYLFFFPMRIKSVLLSLYTSLNSLIRKAQLLCSICEWIFICK